VPMQEQNTRPSACLALFLHHGTIGAFYEFRATPRWVHKLSGLLIYLSDENKKKQVKSKNVVFSFVLILELVLVYQIIKC
jgi:hypothetical protein